MVSCACGCGRPTLVAKRTVGKFGWVKGQHKRFVRGHNSTGNTNADRNSGAYCDVHAWMARHFPKTGSCEGCGKLRGRKAHDYASIGHTYTRNRDDWRELCQACHRKMDNG